MVPTSGGKGAGETRSELDKVQRRKAHAFDSATRILGILFTGQVQL